MKLSAEIIYLGNNRDRAVKHQLHQSCAGCKNKLVVSLWGFPGL